MKMFVFPHSGGFGYQYGFMKKYHFNKIDEVFTYDYKRTYLAGNTVTTESSFEERVEAAVQWILSKEVSTGEVVLFGHSLGAFVAYEAGMVLKNRYAINPAGVIMSSQNPPAAYPETREHFRKLHADVGRFLESLGGMPDEINRNKASLEFYKAIVKSDVQLLDRYEPTIPGDADRLDRIVAFYGDNDPILDFTKWEQWKLCADDCRLFQYEGNHFYLFSEMTSVMEKIDANI